MTSGTIKVNPDKFFQVWVVLDVFIQLFITTLQYDPFWIFCKIETVVSLQSQLKNIPISPGVYHFTNAKKEIIYIGKAKNLRSRVRSYFQKGKSHSSKNMTMIRHIQGLEWIVVSSEVEALLTESNLIKQHSPRYNIMMKDDKTFPFIRITNEPFSQVLLTRKIVKDGSS